MYIQRSIILIVLAAYVFSPTVFNWMINPDGAWYRPYMIWGGLVLVAFLLQLNRNQDQDRHDV